MQVYAVVKVDRRIRWHYTTTKVYIWPAKLAIYILCYYFAFALVHDSRGIEIVNFTTAAALSTGTLIASAGTPYRLVPAYFYPRVYETSRRLYYRSASWS